eukprot:1196154-Prorocentrum_minimum.AAC.1
MRRAPTIHSIAPTIHSIAPTLRTCMVSSPGMSKNEVSPYHPHHRPYPPHLRGFIARVRRLHQAPGRVQQALRSGRLEARLGGPVGEV